jgi:hypothetical protein
MSIRPYEIDLETHSLYAKHFEKVNKVAENLHTTNRSQILSTDTQNVRFVYLPVFDTVD